MIDNVEELQKRVAALEAEVHRLQRTSIPIRRGVRKRSKVTWFGLPLYDIATGPDPDGSSLRGHARGVIAVGEVATGLIAFGGLAFGGIAVGGVSVGLFSIGGLAIGLLAAFGGGAVGTFAFGGGAIGFVAVGAGAAGYYACGSGAIGRYVISVTQQSPEAIEFFKSWAPSFVDTIMNEARQAGK